MKLKILRFLDAAVEYSVYGLIFFIPISIAMIGSFAGFVLAFFLLKKILFPDFSSIKANKVLFLFLLLFFVFMGLSLFNSGPLLAKSLKVLILKWGRFPLLLWAIIDTFKDTKRIVKAVYVLLFSAALVGLTVFTQKFFGFEFLRGRGSWGHSLPSIGPFKNPNALAAYLTCVIPLALSLSLWKWKKAAVRLCLFLITIMLILSSLWALSRGGWLGVVSGLILIVLVTNRLRLKKVFWPLFLVCYLFFVPLLGLLLFFFQNRRDSYRFTLFRGAGRMIREHPFLGKGIGTFMDYCASYTNSPGIFYAHNCFLQIWAESGVFSLLCFLLFMGYIFYRSIRISLSAPGSLGSFALLGLTAGLLGFLVHSFFEVHLYSFQLSFLFWTVLGLTVALSSKLEQEPVFKP
ncbi:MAG: O-antigen ligase family protein [Candidatus Omnitrophota bacterium]|jgi:O-antigen ligase